MQKSARSVIRDGMMCRAGVFALAAMLITASGSVSAKDENIASKDPARWSQDLTTPQQQAANLRKEAAAAYAQARKECEEHAKGDRKSLKSCNSEASMHYKADLQQADMIAGSKSKGQNKLKTDGMSK